MRYVELRRHTDNDGDRLSEQGIADAEAIGRTGLHPPYALFVSTGAERAELWRRALAESMRRVNSIASSFELASRIA